MCVHVCVHSATGYMWSPEDSFVELVLSFKCRLPELGGKLLPVESSPSPPTVFNRNRNKPNGTQKEN